MSIPAIPKEKFEFANTSDKIHDKKFDDKPIGYFKDAWLRFQKNRSSVVAAVIIILIIAFSVFCPLFITTHDNSFSDTKYQMMPARIAWAKENLGILDGGKNYTNPTAAVMRLTAIGIGAADPTGKDTSYAAGSKSEYNPIISVEYAGDFLNEKKQKEQRYNYRLDEYLAVGFEWKQVSPAEYEKMRQWEEETGKPLFYPLIERNEWNTSSTAPNDPGDPNVWFKASGKTNKPVTVDANGKPTEIKYSENMVLEDNYQRDADGNPIYFEYVGGSESPEYRVRVLYYNYYQYKNGFEPNYIMGTDKVGYDMALRIAGGIQTSLIIAVAVCAINFILGAMYGAVEGYYGGTLDLILERVSDILSGVPFIVVATLFRLHLAKHVGPIVCLLFAYIVTGWIGTAYRVRTQFYRFKNQEYVMAARTLGANDTRIIWKHIFPNTLGTIITSSALAIPGAIMSESMLSYLGIISLGGKDGTSLGTLLNDAQSVWSQAPHLLLFPALVISLLMICFNLFGNGLRDAFNPSLRGVEE